MSRLALLGGPRTITRPFTPYRTIGAEEAAAAMRVIESGVLSKFVGSWGPDFHGGPQVQAFEQAWAGQFGVPHAVAMNSNTSGLIAAIGALGVEPGDEVIVTPWTMAASATAILVWNAIPVFADIEPETFNLDPTAVEKAITPRTRAIVAVDIFGHAAELDTLMTLARRHGLKVIEDAAQAPGALYRGRPAGTIADIGVFSLNYHKHIHTGEGGVCVTRDARLAERMQMIRNHAEVAVVGRGTPDLANMIGFNFRMTEIEAAIGIEQLKKLGPAVAQRIRAADRLGRGLAGLRGLRVPVVREGCTHVYYMYPLVCDAGQTGVSRARLADALKAEGVDINEGYVNVHRLPLYQKKQAYGTGGFPWSAPFSRQGISYAQGICPVAERLHDADLLAIELCVYRYDDAEVDLVIEAFRKVWGALRELQTDPGTAPQTAVP